MALCFIGRPNQAAVGDRAGPTVATNMTMTRSEDEIAWRPYGYYRNKSNIARFMDRYGYEEYEELRPDTESEIATFWERAAEDIGIVWEEPYDEVLDTSDGPAFAEWFTGGRLNATATLLDRWVERTPDKPAYIWESETGERERVTYAELDERTNRMANALRSEGIGKGDVVAIVFPLHPNAFVAALACLKIGAIQTHVFPGYGASAIQERLADCDAQLVVTADGYHRAGSEIGLSEKVLEAASSVASIDRVVRDEIVGLDETQSSLPMSSYQAFTEDYGTAAEPTIVDSEDPALIAYTSGTTGTPKGTIQTQVSMLVSGSKELKYQYDVGDDEVYLWITDFGWIVVPVWLIGGAQSLGATTVLMDGSPTHPSDDRIWETVERHGVSLLGMSPTGARQLRERTPTPRENYDLSTLRILGSTAEPWDVETWNWYFDAVGGGHLPVINESGGTETAGGLLGVSPLTPIKPGTLWGPAPGIPANVYDEDGQPTDEGYLVIEGPIPGMTRSLTGGDERYLDVYWSDFDDVWNHDDWVDIDEDGFWFIRGRADDTMNVSGRRITAQTIEAIIEDHPAIDDSAVVGVSDPAKGEVPVAFVTLAEETDQVALGAAVNDRISEDLGPMFKLDALHVVSGFPRTQTDKVARSAIAQVYEEGVTRDTSTFKDGDVLEAYPRRQ